MGFFTDQKANVQTHRSSGGGLYFKPGMYVCRLNAFKIKEPSQQSGTALIVEFEVLQSNNEDLPVGCRPAIYHELSGDKFNKYRATFLGNVADAARGVIACKSAMMGEEVDPASVELTDEMMDEMVNEKDPYELAGTVCGVEAFNIKTKEDKDFTKTRIFVPDNLAEFMN